ncbi:DUF481 domain-containing protein [Vibrio sp. HDW18]|uniref:DUF481 domain-containing protein n=1 Tax=Vibrio sp. HDW18 TaxID=2714948 RepID=UPI0014076AA9|nr:DUF481 domain-containing protein [Vibrio sp. HDW18]QIL85254.1 DUF481 domain-containing protein [Vibrio sp. HDW18]
MNFYYATTLNVEEVIVFPRWLTWTSLALCFPALAEPAKSNSDIRVPSPWSHHVEFGYQAHTGNTDSQSLTSRMKSEYTSGRHRTYGEWKFYKLDKNGKANKHQSTYALQSDYKLGPKTYLYASFYGTDSRYSAYFKDYTLSAGLGYQFVYTEDFTLEVEVGPGFRYQKPNQDEIDKNDIVFPDQVNEGIFRGNLKSEWQALANLCFAAELTMVSGGSNTSVDSDLSVTNKITDNIGLKIRQSRQFHNRVPEGLSKEDSVFSVNLRFQF